VLPAPDAMVLDADGADPAELAMARESIRLAFVAVLQGLPPRQRAVLILREVLRMEATEVAALLDTTVASVNSALQRARAGIAAAEPAPDGPARPDDPAQRALLARYMDAFERYDIPALTALLREDAVQSMPPYELWLRGRDDILAWWVGPGAGCRGSRLVPTVANGRPAFGQYRPAPDGGYRPWALQVLEPGRDGIAEFTFYLDTERLFPLFGLPSAPPPR
jgi:RNA polymerase sigma-70 factor (ECF subfamily)